MILSTRNYVTLAAIGWILALLTVTGLFSACSPNRVENGPSDTIVMTSMPLTPSVSYEENETFSGKSEFEPHEATITRGIESAATSTINPTLTITREAEATQRNDSASPVIEIPLVGPVSSNQAELSGLAWYGDYLIILPQFPDFDTGEGDGFIYTLTKADLISFLDGKINGPLEPRQIPFLAPGLQEGIEGFEGYEAIAFLGDNVFVTIESRDASGMLGYLVKGAIAPDLSSLTLDTFAVVSIAPQDDTKNMSEESLFVVDQMVGTIYELNGSGVNISPVVHIFDRNLTPMESVSFPYVDFRLTDVSELDQEDRFWAINYFYPGTGEFFGTLGPQEGSDGSVRTQLAWKGMGRLVEFQYAQSGITLTDTDPIQLELLLSDIHNWEGLARLENRGFLIVSDEFPDTALGFVPIPTTE